MPFRPPAYPQELTDKWWQSKKGTIAKVATKNDGTGIGKKLEELKRAYDKINWDGLDPDLAPGTLGGRTPDQVKQLIARGKQAAQAIQPVYKQAVALEIDAKNLAAEWARSKVIPRSSTAAATTVSQKAKELSFHISMGTLAGLVERSVKEEAAEAKKKRDLLAKLVAGMPAALDKLAVDARAGVSVAEWPNFWKQNVRFVGTQMVNVIKLYPGAANEIAAVRVHSNKQRTPADQKELDTWLTDLARGADALRAKMA